MSQVESFPPIEAPGARVLVLGSMPGVASLAAQRYYAHPRNAFWPIWAELVGFDAAAPYDERCDRLRKAGVAVWDVLRECHRPGSLDSRIEPDSERPNDLVALLARRPTIRAVLFNGQKAEAAWRRHVAPTLAPATPDRLTLRRLPSTSPAHAARSLDEKLAAWRAAFAALT